MFRIVTDTSSNLPTAYLQAENITVIPFTFHTESGEQSCMDTATFDAKAFYTAMRNGEKVTTSQIPPQRFVDYLHPMLEAGEDVLFVSMSSGISGSYASSKIAANQLQEEFPERKILTVDTYSASLAEGLVVMHAVECREKGMTIEDGIFYACSGTVKNKLTARKTISSTVLGKEGFFNLSLVGEGIAALESNVPYEELIEVELDNDELKIDGNLAVCWSSGLEFTVERSTKTLVGSAVSGEGLVNVYRGTGKVLMSPVAPTASLYEATHTVEAKPGVEMHEAE